MKKFLLIGLTAVILITSCLTVAADDLKTIQQQKSKVDNTLKNISAEKKRIQAEKKRLESEKKDLLSQQASVNSEYKKLMLEINEIDEELLKIDEDIVNAEQDYEDQRALLKTRLRVMMDNSSFSSIESLIRSKSVTDFFDRIELYSLISRKDKDLVNDLMAAKQDVEYKKQMAEQLKQETKDKADQKQDKIQTLTASRADLDQKIRKSQTDLKRLEAQEDELYKQSQELESTISSLTSKKTKYLGSGKLTWPVPGHFSVTSPYGYRTHPILHKKKMHTGIDIDADKGNTIVAAEKGTVIISGWKSGYGNTVVIDHGGGYTTLYGHASKLYVKVGEEVKKGEKIAAVGSTGLSTGPHLHFELRKNGKPIDPNSSIK